MSEVLFDQNESFYVTFWKSLILEQTCSLKLQFCSGIDDILLPCIKGLKLVFLAISQNSWEKSIFNFKVKLQAYN